MMKVSFKCLQTDWDPDDVFNVEENTLNVI